MSIHKYEIQYESLTREREGDFCLCKGRVIRGLRSLGLGGWLGQHILNWGGIYRAEARGRPLGIGRVALLRS